MTIVLFSFLFFLVGCSGQENGGTGYVQVSAVEDLSSISMTVGDNLPVSRGLAAKMIALTFSSINDIDSMEREIEFTDTSPDRWYDRYINAVFVQGLMSGYDGLFMPEMPLSLQQAQNILDTIDENNSIRLQINNENRDMPISYALWCQLYIQALENISGEIGIEQYFGIRKKDYVILAAEGNNPMLIGGTIITDRGPFVSEGLINDSFVDTEVTILEKNGQVIAILSVNTTEPIIRNALVVGNDSDSITIFSGGVERVYEFSNNLRNLSGQIVDIQISGNEALSVHVHENIIPNQMIERISYNFIELQGMGRLNISDDFKVYTTVNGDVRWRTPRHLIVGTDIAQFIMNEDDEVVAAVINETPILEYLRVAISTTNFESLIHEHVDITATSDFIVRGQDETREFSAGEVISFREHADLFGNDRVYIEVLEATGRIQLDSIRRNWPGDISPRYRGIFEIAREDTGFTVINVISMDEYLYAVVPSEMPSAYGVEPSKAQAITARSFAHNQFFENRFHRHGANIDDSVMSQVYNNIPENLTSIQAVDETRGMYLTFLGEVVSANFFSTSSGMTANAGEVWVGSMNRFPTESRPFLQATRQYMGQDFGDLTIEENAAAFFRATDIDSYDNISPWFRWEVQMTAEQVAATINANLEARYRANPFLIRTLQSDGMFRSREVNTIGDLVNIEVLTRGEGGNIMEMRITGTENTILVRTEYNIRRLISPVNHVQGAEDVVLRRIDGTFLLNYGLMPSSFYTMERLTDGYGNILYVRFLGGGNGHGAGMSQYGAKGKLARGYNFIEVLQHFYAGAEVTLKD